MKILISHTSLYKKSGWGRIFPLAIGLSEAGNQVTILTTNNNISLFTKKISDHKVNIIIYPEIIPSRISRLGFGFLSLIKKIIHVIFHKYDVVHSDNGHRPLAGIPCRIHKRLHNSVYIAEWYDWYGKGGQYDSKKRFFKLLLGWYELRYEIKDKQIADGIVVLSNELFQRGQNLSQSKKIIKLHGGCDVEAIPYLHDNKLLKQKYGINPDIITFGYIESYSSTLDEIQLLIHVILKLKLEEKVKFLLFGNIQSNVGQMNFIMKNMIVNYGWINYKEEYEKLQCVDVFVMLKQDTLLNRAGWPNAIGDYLAVGRPILLNPIGEVIEFVEKYPEGFFNCSLTNESIVKFLNIIMTNRSLLLEKGLINRLLAEREISWKRKSQILYDFYNEVISNKE